MAADVQDKAARHARLHPPRYTFQLGQEAVQTLRRLLKARRQGDLRPLAERPAK
jgi:hypothetical protein